MSFSVHARAFVPSSAAAPSSSAAKECVCVAFYENARCPYGDQCEHAHRFSELTSSTQAKLLGSVPVESIPSHFFTAAPAKTEEAAAEEGAGTSRTHFSPLRATEVERTVSTRRRPPGKDHQLVVSHIARHTPTSDTASVSSRTSSGAESPHLGAAHGSKGASLMNANAAAANATAAAGAFDTAAFKMHLPLRCRYPHRTIPGTYYDVLALPRGARHEEIVAKYRAWQRDGFKRMRLVDPVGAEAVDRMIVESRNVLGNPVLRAAYDQQLPAAEPKQVSSWSTALNAGTTSTITTPSKRCTQGQSSATSSASETLHRPDSSHARLGYCSSSSSVYHADMVAPVVTISSMRSRESIW